MNEFRSVAVALFVSIPLFQRVSSSVGDVVDEAPVGFTIFAARLKNIVDGSERQISFNWPKKSWQCIGGIHRISSTDGGVDRVDRSCRYP